MTDRQRDRLLALLTAAFATSYIAAARAIEDSLLADEVGAGGVPQGVGLVMLLAALALFAKSFVGAAPVEAAPVAAAAAPHWRAAALRTTGLVVVLLAYGALLPWAGYPVSVSLLVLAAGRLAGAALGATLLWSALLAGPGMWLLFDRLLQVRMPLGTLWS